MAIPIKIKKVEVQILYLISTLETNMKKCYTIHGDSWELQ